jgi:hypothetical protein
MVASDTSIPRDPTEDEALALFAALEEQFPSKSLGNDKWYILAVRNPFRAVQGHPVADKNSMQPWSVAASLDLHLYSTKSSSKDLNTKHQNNAKG